MQIDVMTMGFWIGIGVAGGMGLAFLIAYSVERLMNWLIIKKPTKFRNEQ